MTKRSTLLISTCLSTIIIGVGGDAFASCGSWRTSEQTGGYPGYYLSGGESCSVAVSGGDINQSVTPGDLASAAVTYIHSGSDSTSPSTVTVASGSGISRIESYQGYISQITIRGIVNRISTYQAHDQTIINLGRIGVDSSSELHFGHQDTPMLSVGDYHLINGDVSTRGIINAEINTYSNGAVTVENVNGTINGVEDDGIDLAGEISSLTILNAAGSVISGGAGESAVQIDAAELGTGGTHTITNHGTLSSGSLTSSQASLGLTAFDIPALELGDSEHARNGAGVTVFNDGTINGSIVLANAADTVILAGGSLNGNVASTESAGPGYLHVTGDALLGGSARQIAGAHGTSSFTNNSFGTIEIDAGKTLSIGNSTLDRSIYATIKGSGDLRKIGSNTVTLVGDDTLTGTTWIDQGGIRLSGSLAGAVVVGSAGAFRSVGSLGSVGSLVNAGLLSIGTYPTIGTLRVNGNFTQTSTGSVDIKITPTSSDKITVAGTADLDGTMYVLPQSGTYTNGTTYTVISAQSVKGAFKAVTVSEPETLGGLALGAEYTGTEVKLILGSAASVSARQQEESVKAVAPEVARQAAATISNLIGTRVASILSPVSFGRVSTPATGGAGPTGTGSGGSGGSGSSGTNTGSDTSPDGKKKDDKTSQAPGTGLAAGDEASDLSGLSLWADAGLTFLNNSRTGSEYNGTHKALVLGADYRLGDKFIVGLALAPDLANLKLRSVDGTRDTAGVGLSLYAGYKLDDTYFMTAVAGYGRAFTSSSQLVGGAKVEDDYGSNRWNGRLAFSAGYMLGDAVRLTPTLSYAHSIETTATHHSSDGAEIKLPTTNIGTVGADLQLDYALNDKIIPFVSGGVAHDVINSSGDRGRTGFSAGGGFQAPIDDNLNIGAMVVGEFGRDKQTSLRIGANARFSW